MVRVIPFPPFSIGTDICHIPRITRIIVRDKDGRSITRFIRRILTEPERSMIRPKLDRYLNAYKDEDKVSKDQALHELSQWLAGRSIMVPARLSFYFESLVS